jgi:hypothetical protein
MAEGGEKRSKTGHRTPSQVKRHTRTYGAKPEQKKNRAARNAARAQVKKTGANVAGKDVGHKKPLSKGGSNAKGNLKVQSRASNRGHGMTKGKKANRGK